jgi:hypothetical protein
MKTTTTLTAEAEFGFGGKQYIARITGRDPKFTFAREFVGRKSGKRGETTTHETDEPGLYMTVDVDKRGKDETFYIVYDCPGVGILKTPVDRIDMMGFARRLDDGPVDFTRIALEYRVAYDAAGPDEIVRLADAQFGLPVGPTKRGVIADAIREYLATLDRPTATPVAPGVDLSAVDTASLVAELARRGIRAI